MDQLSALLASVAVESVTVTILFARRARRTLVRAIAVAALSTIATHPLAWWSIEALEPTIGYWVAVVTVEALVCLAEAMAYRLMVPLDWPTSLVVSAGANGTSTLAGLLYYAAAS
jgi:hypothetical protein